MRFRFLLVSTSAYFILVLCALLAAAHHLRAGNSLVCALYLAIPLVLLIPRFWVARGVQIALLLAALEWLRIIPGLVEVRQILGLPWLRMTAILGSITLLTTLSVALFRLRPLQSRYFPTTP